MRTAPTLRRGARRAPVGVAVTHPERPVTVAAGSSQEFFAVPTTGYYFATNADDQWTFTRK